MAASVLFLRPAVMRRLLQASAASAAVAGCLAAFSNPQRIAIHAERSSVTALPLQERERVFHRLENVAAGHGLTVKRCACKNPNISSGMCSIAGEWQRTRARAEVTLFD
ncbi:MAG: hypothetical protein GTN65_14345 [Armatimonadetes bacterium]|nr:hypothetical protein [Armatimonadota bacterium]NIO98241.1 hypothetical protein [Armatimonadota bacterium]